MLVCTGLVARDIKLAEVEFLALIPWLRFNKLSSDVCPIAETTFHDALHKSKSFFGAPLRRDERELQTVIDEVFTVTLVVKPFFSLSFRMAIKTINNRCFAFRGGISHFDAFRYVSLANHARSLRSQKLFQILQLLLLRLVELPHLDSLLLRLPPLAGRIVDSWVWRLWSQSLICVRVLGLLLLLHY